MTTEQIKDLSEAYWNLCRGTAVWLGPLVAIWLARRGHLKLNRHSLSETTWYIVSIFGISCLATILVQFVDPPVMVLGGLSWPIFRFTPQWVNFTVLVIIMGMVAISIHKISKK